MGGGQSQERVVGVEEQQSSDGQSQIIVTEDFLKHLDDKQGGEEGGGSGDPRAESHDEDEEEEDDIPYVSAEELLIGQPGAESAEHSSSRREEEKWRKRYELERQKNRSLKSMSSKEFEKTVNQVRDKFAEKTRQDVVPVCEDCKDKVMDCYRSNPGRPLNCSSEVQDYVQCVERARKGVLRPSPSL